jgi:RNA recognition motif-containing protein
MSVKIYVGNIAFSVTEEDIRGLFAPFGEIESVKLINDPQTGRSRGFGFVEMASNEDARKAIEGLNDKPFKDRNLAISVAKPQQPRSGGFGDRNRGFGGRKNSGGYGGGGRRPDRGRR